MQKIGTPHGVYAATVTCTRKEFAMFAAFHPDGADRAGAVNDLVHADRELSVLDASKLMGRRGAEALLVIERGEGALVPLAVVTARDIVTRVVAAGLDPAVVTVGDIAWPDGATMGSENLA
jgi:CBS domain-containing protein